MAEQKLRLANKEGAGAKASAPFLLSIRYAPVTVSQQPHFDLVHVWYLSVCSMFLQAVVSFTLLRREFRRKLTNLAPAPQPA